MPSEEEEITLSNQCVERGSMLGWSASPGMDEALRKFPLRHVRCLTLTPNGEGFLYSMHNVQSFWSSSDPVTLAVDVDHALRTPSRGALLTGRFRQVFRAVCEWEVVVERRRRVHCSRGGAT